MSKLKLLGTATIAILISTSGLAASDSNMPDKSAMTHGSMMDDAQSQNMPMMDMQMMHGMMHRMEAMGHGYNQGHGHRQNQGMGNMMMNPQMMQMRMQHMANMEERLKNIESLLSQLVELQKTE